VDITLWIEVVLFIVLMLFSGFFSSSETSLFSLSKMQLEQMRRDDTPNLPLIERLLSQPRRLIVTILIGNEFVNVAASVISAAIVIQLLGAENKFVNLFIMVPILLLFGEITPKTLAIRNNVAFASLQSRPIELFARAIKPLRWIVRLVADGVTTLLIGKERTLANIVTEDMVRTLAREALGAGALAPSEASYIDHIFDFGNKTVEELMTPRSNIFYLPSNLPFTEMVQELRRTRHTKVPVYGQHRDDIIGILYARDLLGIDPESVSGSGKHLQRLLREPYFVPESKLASDLFHAFRQRKQSLALMVDEYGGVTGLLSMEDLLECIFGDIPSASDVMTTATHKELDSDGLHVDGSLLIEQFNKDFGEALPGQGPETVGGLILHSFTELPATGSSIDIGALEFVVDKIASNRIESLTVRKFAPEISVTDTADGENNNREETPHRRDADTSPHAAANCDTDERS